MEKLVLDYSDFVEKTCEEKDAVYESYPSIADVERSASRFIDTVERPADPFNVTYSYQNRAIELWGEFDRSRSIAFGDWHHLDQCPYCNSSVQTTYVTDEEIEAALFREKTVRKCCNCGWWDIGSGI